MTGTTRLLLAVVLAGCAHHPYVLPAADGGAGTPSAPSLEGDIVSVEGNALIIATNQAPHGLADRCRVHVTGSTAIFTVYGGYIGADQLQAGQKARIWFSEPQAKCGAMPVAAVIMVPSKQPGDPWP